MSTQIFKSNWTVLDTVIFDQGDPAREAEEVGTGVETLHLAGQVLEEADAHVLPRLPQRELGLQVGLSVKVGGHDVALPLQRVGCQQHQVAGELLLVLDGENVPDPDVLALDALQPPVPDHPHHRLVCHAVVTVTQQILITLQTVASYPFL